MPLGWNMSDSGCEWQGACVSVGVHGKDGACAVGRCA